jgi:hypothetical protein
MTKPSLTIAIPFHSGVEFLKLAVQSVLAQEDPEWQLIVSDDGDRPALEVQEFLEGLGDERLRYHRAEPGLGMVAHWNLQFDLAQTECLSLLHQDDCLLPNYVGLMRGLAAEHGDVAAFFAGAKIIDAKGADRFSFADWIKRFLKPSASGAQALEGKQGVEALLRGNFIMCPTLCYRRSAMAAWRFDGRWKQVQDLDLTCRMLQAGARILGSSSQAYAYRRHAQAATSLQSESLLRFREECDFLDEMSARCRELGWERAARIAASKRVVKLHLGYRILGDLLGLRWRSAKSKITFLWRLK